MAKKAIACASSGFDMSFISSNKAKIIHRNFVVLPGWADAFAFPKEVLTQLNAPSISPTKCRFKLSQFIQSACLGEESFRAEE